MLSSLRLDLDADKPKDRYYEMTLEVSRGIKELQAMIEVIKSRRF
jgi:hypothetical protein